MTDRRPFTPEEIAELERANPILRGGQDFTGTHLIWESLAFVREMNLTAATASALEREFRSIAAWHEFRGRPDLAERYQRCADNFGMLLVSEKTDKENN